MLAVIDYLRLALGDGHRSGPGRVDCPCARPANAGGHSRLGARSALRRLGDRLHGALEHSPRRDRAAGALGRGARAAAPEAAAARDQALPARAGLARRIGLAGLPRARLARRGRARLAALARRGPGHRRRAVPRGAGAQARRVRRPPSADGRRVQGRRAAPRLRLPPLARLPRAGRLGLPARRRHGRPPRAVGARAARLRPDLGVGRRALRLLLGRSVGADRLAGPVLLRTGPRRLVRDAGAARHDRSAVARAGGARPVLRLDRDALARGARRDGGDLRRARPRAPDVRALPAAAARRATRSCGPPSGGCPSSGLAAARRAGGSGRSLAEADRGRDALAQPGRQAARAEHRAVPLATRRVEPPSLSPRPRGARPERCRGRCGACARTRHGARVAQAVGRVRARGHARRAGADGGALAVRAFLERRLPLPVAARSRVLAAAVRVRGGSRTRRPHVARPAGVTRRGHRPATALAR